MYLSMISAFPRSSIVDNSTELVFPTPESQSSFFLSNIPYYFYVLNERKTTYTKGFSPQFYSILIQKIKSIYPRANTAVLQIQGAPLFEIEVNTFRRQV